MQTTEESAKRLDKALDPKLKRNGKKTKRKQTIIAQKEQVEKVEESVVTEETEQVIVDVEDVEDDSWKSECDIQGHFHNTRNIATIKQSRTLFDCV
jgi:hypothetical protein